MNIKKLNEEMESLLEVKAGRGWQGKLKRIDDLLAWMYSKGLMTKTEMKKKDTVFHRYYRYYNDGDIPRGLKLDVDTWELKNLDKLTPERKEKLQKQVDQVLEEDIEKFVKSVLSKYFSKIDRKQFRLDTTIQAIDNCLHNSDNLNLFSNLINQLKPGDEKLVKMAQSLKNNVNEFYKLVLSTPIDQSKVTDDNKIYKHDGLEVLIEKCKKLGIFEGAIKQKAEQIKVEAKEALEMVKNLKRTLEKYQKIEEK